MTKKRTSPSKKRTSGKKGGNLSVGGVILTIVVLGILYIADAAGLVDINFEALLNGGNSSNSDGAVSAPASTPIRVEPVTGEWYKIYFTTPHYPDEPEIRTQTIVDGLIEVINNTQRSLDIAIYELDLAEVGDAILAAQDRGVNVRLVTDTDTLEELETLKRLEDEGIPIVPDDRGPIMHNKFVVTDNQAVWTGSWNFTPNGTYRNNNHGIFINSSELAQNYTAEFEEMFVDHAFGPKSPANTRNPRIIIGDTLIETCFAPEDECAVQLTRLLGQAQQSIRFMAFSFTHDDFGQAIRDRAKAGVLVQGVFETRGSDTEYSEFGRMKKDKLDVWQDGNPYTLHHKVFIIDDETVVLGSYNFSSNADEANDENVLVIHNADIAKEFVAEFNRVYNQAQSQQD